MEVLIGLVIIIGLLVLLDLAALKWGADQRINGWLEGSYDPRHDWNSPLTFWDELDNNQKNLAGVESVHS